MSVQNKEIKSFVEKKYEHGFVTDTESEQIEPGLTEETVRRISAKKEEPEFLLEWRLKAFRHWESRLLDR